VCSAASTTAVADGADVVAAHRADEGDDGGGGLAESGERVADAGTAGASTPPADAHRGAATSEVEREVIEVDDDEEVIEVDDSDI